MNSKTGKSGEYRLNLTLQSVNPLELEATREKVRKQIEGTRISSAPPSPMDHTIEAAERFSSGLDSVTDVLLLLVLKFGRVTNALIVIGGILILCLLGLVVSLINVMTLSSNVSKIMIQQNEIMDVQRSTYAQTKETKKKLDNAEIKADPAIKIVPSP